MCPEYDVRIVPDGASLDTVRSRTVARPVVEAVAELEGTDPLALDPLADWIDVESVDRLVRSDRTGGECRLSFRYLDYDVTIRSPATVEIRDATGEMPDLDP